MEKNCNVTCLYHHRQYHYEPLLKKSFLERYGGVLNASWLSSSADHSVNNQVTYVISLSRASRNCQPQVISMDFNTLANIVIYSKFVWCLWTLITLKFTLQKIMHGQWYIMCLTGDGQLLFCLNQCISWVKNIFNTILLHVRLYLHQKKATTSHLNAFLVTLMNACIEDNTQGTVVCIPSIPA